MTNKKTKIVATIGPVSEKEEKLEKLILLGMNAARLNFSHGSHEEQGNRIKTVRKLEKKLKRHIAVIADIQGPKIRIGILPEVGVMLKNGQEITIDTGTREYYEERIPLPSLLFCDGTKPGHLVFLDDGTLQIKITEKKGSIFKAVVLKGGTLFAKKGVNVPSLEIKSSILNAKDRADIAFAVKAGADYVALSFLRNAKDIKDAKRFIGKSPVKIIAKIERPEALENLDEIIDEADAIMVARGDLGIETPLWELPIRQKEIVEKVRSKMKPVIVATQMLDSMIRNPIPTRAEVSDVANAVFDGADAVMLSGESAQGKYPLEAVEMMSKVVQHTEKNLEYPSAYKKSGDATQISIARSITNIAHEVGAKAIITGAVTGSYTKVIASLRAKTPIIATTNSPVVARQLGLVWGVTSVVVNTHIKSAKDLLSPTLRFLKAEKLLKTGDKVLFRYNEKISDPTSSSAITIENIK